MTIYNSKYQKQFYTICCILFYIQFILYTLQYAATAIFFFKCTCQTTITCCCCYVYCVCVFWLLPLPFIREWLTNAFMRLIHTFSCTVYTMCIHAIWKTASSKKVAKHHYLKIIVQFKANFNSLNLKTL